MKILIADDHALFRDGLSLHIEKLYPKAVILQSANFSQAVKIVQTTPDLDLLIIDLDMPDMDWTDGIRTLQEASRNRRWKNARGHRSQHLDPRKRECHS